MLVGDYIRSLPGGQEYALLPLNKQRDRMEETGTGVGFFFYTHALNPPSHPGFKVDVVLTSVLAVLFEGEWVVPDRPEDRQKLRAILCLGVFEIRKKMEPSTPSSVVE